MGVGGQRHAQAALPPGRRPGTHYTESWVGTRTGLAMLGESRPPPGFDRPARIKSLYRLRYPGPHVNRILYAICYEHEGQKLYNIGHVAIFRPEDGHNRWPKHVGGYADVI
jgi:hypothetical protein